MTEQELLLERHWNEVLEKRVDDKLAPLIRRIGQLELDLEGKKEPVVETKTPEIAVEVDRDWHHRGSD